MKKILVSALLIIMGCFPLSAHAQHVINFTDCSSTGRPLVWDNDNSYAECVSSWTTNIPLADGYLISGDATGVGSSYEFIETQFIPISWCTDGAAAPDALETKTSTNGEAQLRTFAGDSTEDVNCVWSVPADIIATAGIKFRVRTMVTESTAPSSEGMAFYLKGFSLTTGDAFNGTFNTAVISSISTRSDAQYDLIDTGYSAAITDITSLAAGELVVFNLYRKHDDALDTYAQKIGVIGFEIKYKRNLRLNSW